MHLNLPVLILSVVWLAVTGFLVWIAWDSGYDQGWWDAYQEMVVRPELQRAWSQRPRRSRKPRKPSQGL